MTPDIQASRLVLRLMSREIVEACLSGDLARASRLLGVAIPAELLEEPAALRFALKRLDDTPGYAPWSIRAMIHRQERRMVGHIRFHSTPDPDYLRPYARDAVEFGYHVFAGDRRQRYATEAVGAAMDWAEAAFGIRTFIVTVSPDNTPSLALIAGYGFRKIGEHMDEVDGLEHIFLREATCAPASPT